MKSWGTGLHYSRVFRGVWAGDRNRSIEPLPKDAANSLNCSYCCLTVNFNDGTNDHTCLIAILQITGAARAF